MWAVVLLLLLSACSPAPRYREVPIDPRDSIYGDQIQDVNRRLCLERGGQWLPHNDGTTTTGWGCLEKQ